jgi:alkaline phosphatase D
MRNRAKSASRLSRRAFLGGAGGALSALVLPSTAVGAASRLPGGLFSLGVASGDPWPDGFVIWTRLAPRPADGGSMPAKPVAVDWEIAADENMRRTVRRGRVIARPEAAHSVHVELRGLAPARSYWYRFRAGGELSTTGRAVTAPSPGASPDLLRIAVASCQHYEFGYYAAYRHMVADRPDLILHLGDYIYEYAGPKALTPSRVRLHPRYECRTLEQYRDRYALYRSDPDLQAAHAWCPWIAVTDDHEVSNDYAGDQSQSLTPVDEFRARKAAAYQAYYEHMPLRAASRPRGSRMRQYRRIAFGNLASFHMLDIRQYRSVQACGDGKHGGGRIVYDCAALDDPSRSMLGAAQEAWLFESLKHSRARWHVIGQQMLMTRLRQPDETGRIGYLSDGWDGYMATRRKLLDFLARNRISNPVVLGGDIHSFWITDLKADFDRPESATIATEFTGTSISSPGISYSEGLSVLPANPQVRYFESRYRGYLLCDITPSLWLTDLRIVDNVRDRSSGARTLASFYVQAGHPGALRR